MSKTMVLTGMALAATVSLAAQADNDKQATDNNMRPGGIARVAQGSNIDATASHTFAGHELSILNGTDPADAGAAFTWLYCPSEGDDPGMRAAIDAVYGSASDYYDATGGTPDVATLAAYDAVWTWANFAYADNVLMGDNLAQYADGGGLVVLGAFCTYTSGNFLSGQIMTPGYAPVWSPTGSNHFTPVEWSGDNPCGSSAYDGIAGGTMARQFRDILALQGTGVQCGSDFDGEITMAGSNVFSPGGNATVVYANGSGGNAALGTPAEHNIWLANIMAGAGATPVDCVCDGVWSVGDRVVKFQETGSGGPAVGSVGTVFSGAVGNPPLLVAWDGFAGHDGNGFDSCPPNPTTDLNGWYVNCDEVREAPTACEGDVNGDGRVDVEDLLIVLANWGCQVG